MQFQVLACGDTTTDEPTHIRLILNDGVVPLTGLRGCPEDEEGKCPIDTFVGALKEIIGEVDFAKECGVQGSKGEFVSISQRDRSDVSISL
jgi:hypothetical protein